MRETLGRTLLWAKMDNVGHVSRLGPVRKKKSKTGPHESSMWPTGPTLYPLSNANKATSKTPDLRRNNAGRKMKMFVSHSDLRAMTLNATGLRHHQGLHPVRSDPRRQSGYYRIPHLLLPVRPRAVYGIALEEKTKKKKKNDKKPAICTADELHHVSVPNSDWTLALWRYLPSTQVLPLVLSVFFFFLFLCVFNCAPYSHVFNVFLCACMYVYEMVWVNLCRVYVYIYRHSRGIIRCCCCQGLRRMLLDMISLLGWVLLLFVRV